MKFIISSNFNITIVNGNLSKPFSNNGGYVFNSLRGNLEIRKILADDVPQEARKKTYSFTVKGPNNYNKTINIKGGETVLLEYLVSGTYTVTEDTQAARIDGYSVDVSPSVEQTAIVKNAVHTSLDFNNTWTKD